MNINKDKILALLPKIGKILEITIVSVLLVLLLIRIFVKDPEYYRDNKQEQKAIQLKVDSLYKKQDSISLKIENLEKGNILFYEVISRNNELMEANNKKIETLRRLYNEKINSIDRYTVTDLDSFFRANYGQYYK
jgi:peptidoglycan hydrolase CwlO-like protein